MISRNNGSGSLGVVGGDWNISGQNGDLVSVACGRRRWYGDEQTATINNIIARL